jgi:hypothetical protein
MDYQFWVLLIVNLFGIYLTHRQVRFMEAQAGVNPVPKLASSLALKRYWPMGAMTLLMVACWIPYFSKPKCPSDIFLGWGLNNGRIFATIKTDDLISKRPHRLMIIARMGDNTIDYKKDTQIARSATFEILEPATAMEINLTPEFIAHAQKTSGLVDVYALEVPEEFPIELVQNIASAEKLGGKILASHGFGGFGPAPPNQTPTSH